jgi:type IV pilus assembly protein PilM
VDDSFIEFEILGRTDDNQMDVILVAAPKDIVNSRLAACDQAGLEVVNVDVEVFAAFRSLVETDPEADWQEKTVALVDIGAAKTNMSVVRHGTFAMTRSISQGGGVLTEALRQYFKLSHEEAEQGKAQLDMDSLTEDSGPQEVPPLRVIQPHVDDLIREIRRSLNYYQSQLTEGEQTKNVDMVLMTGGGAKLKGLDKYASHKLKLPTTAIGVFRNPRISYCGTEDLEEGMDLSVVAGLAMRPYLNARLKAA